MGWTKGEGCSQRTGLVPLSTGPKPQAPAPGPIALVWGPSAWPVWRLPGWGGSPPLVFSLPLQSWGAVCGPQLLSCHLGSPTWTPWRPACVTHTCSPPRDGPTVGPGCGSPRRPGPAGLLELEVPEPLPATCGHICPFQVSKPPRTEDRLERAEGAGLRIPDPCPVPFLSTGERGKGNPHGRAPPAHPGCWCMLHTGQEQKESHKRSSGDPVPKVGSRA